MNILNIIKKKIVKAEVRYKALRTQYIKPQEIVG